ERGGRDRLEQRGALLARRVRTVLDEVQDRGRGGEVPVAQARGELRAAGEAQADAAAPTPLASATTETMSAMIRVRSKSFGV
ncbi:MAG: hypothetical protein JWO90_398, partial [Solirubrobacterales bacterium]|nr:hypothetical protein [Solirubrobacterales bacterium]